MSSLLFKLKNLVLGDSDSDDEDRNQTKTDSSSSPSHFTSTSSSSYEVIQTFFKKVTDTLRSYPFQEQMHDLLTSLLDDSNNDDPNYLVPISLEQQRERLLNVQIQVLTQVIQEFQSNGQDIHTQQKNMDLSDATAVATTATHHSPTLKEIQTLLKTIGEDHDMSHITTNSLQQASIRNCMNDMNQAARMAFARSVLYSEMIWLHTQEHYDEHSYSTCTRSSTTYDPSKAFVWPIDYTSSKRSYRRSVHDGAMDRNYIIEYCGLCSAILNLEEVKEYVETGQRIILDTDLIMNEDHYDGKGDKGDKNHHHTRMTYVSAQHRILLLQQLMLCAIGFEPNYGGEEIRRFLSEEEEGEKEEEDVELRQQISTYLLSVQTAAQIALESSTPSVGLSDDAVGGVTRVVSVKYSEKTITGLDGDQRGIAPSNAIMEQHEENESHSSQDFKLIAKAASLQSNILDDLDAMEEGKRIEELRKGRELHDKIMSIVLSLETGLERVQFLQDISPEEQRLLLIHKLWENRKQSMNTL